MPSHIGLHSSILREKRRIPRDAGGSSRLQVGDSSARDAQRFSPWAEAAHRRRQRRLLAREPAAPRARSSRTIARTTRRDVVLVTLARRLRRAEPPLEPRLRARHGRLPERTSASRTSSSATTRTTSRTEELRRAHRRARRDVALDERARFDRAAADSHVDVGRRRARVRVGLVGVVMDDAAVVPRPAVRRRARPPAERSRARRGGAALATRRAARASSRSRTRPSPTIARSPASSGTPPFPVDRRRPRARRRSSSSVDGTWIVKAGRRRGHAAVIDLAWPAEAPATARRTCRAVERSPRRRRRLPRRRRAARARRRAHAPGARARGRDADAARARA